MDISGHDAELRYVDTRLHNESLTLFSVHAFSLDLSPNELFRYMSSKPAKTSPSSSALQDLAIKLACSQLSDMSINQRLWPSSSSQLGIGATFQVESREAKGKKLVAVKHIKRDSADEEQFSYTAPTRERLDDVLLEVQVLLHLKTLQHPNIVEIVGFGWDEGPLPYLVLELADLGSLDKFLNEHELSWSQKELTMIQLASGLEMLHACEIIHGDIKLENVLVFSKEPYGFVAKLADFGFCLANTLGIEVYHGTSVFNPPEMCSGARTSLSNLDYSFEMADVYSYGLVAWEIVNDGGRFYSTSAIGIDPQHSNEALLFLSDLDSTKQELFPYAWKYVESLSLPETLASPLLKILEMSLRRDWGSRSEIREIREVMDLDEE
jgi:serine/threonine protein kinase